MVTEPSLIGRAVHFDPSKDETLDTQRVRNAQFSTGMAWLSLKSQMVMYVTGGRSLDQVKGTLELSEAQGQEFQTRIDSLAALTEAQAKSTIETWGDIWEDACIPDVQGVEPPSNPTRTVAEVNASMDAVVQTSGFRRASGR